MKIPEPKNVSEVRRECLGCKRFFWSCDHIACCSLGWIKICFNDQTSNQHLCDDFIPNHKLNKYGLLDRFKRFLIQNGLY